MAVIWIDMLPSDDADAARRALELLDDPRVTHFHDTEQLAGHAWAETLGLRGPAWDVYLLFDEGATWTAPAPAPRAWFHQLGGDKADPGRRRTAHGLAVALHSAGQEAGWPLATWAPEAGRWRQAREAALARLQTAGAERDGRCADCRAARRLSSCSLGGWGRLLLRATDDGFLMASGTEPASISKGREVRLAVSGLRCPECMLRAAAGAIALDGVDEVEVRLGDGVMRILLAPGGSMRARDLADAVRAQGYGAEVLDAEAD